MKTSCDLGQNQASPCCSPSSSSSEKYYPSLYISDIPSGDLDLPDAGAMTIRYRMRSETENKKSDKCSYELEVLSIESVEGTPIKVTKGSDEALDELADEMMEE